MCVCARCLPRNRQLHPWKERRRAEEQAPGQAGSFLHYYYYVCSTFLTPVPCPASSIGWIPLAKKLHVLSSSLPTVHFSDPISSSPRPVPRGISFTHFQKTCFPSQTKWAPRPPRGGAILLYGTTTTTTTSHTHTHSRVSLG